MVANPNETAVDDAILDRVRQGDQAAFNEVVNRYWDRIFARSFQLLKNREDAEEVTQDTFIRAQRGLENFRGDASFSTWLYQIATNLSHNRYWYWWRRKRGASVSLDMPLCEDSSTTLEEVLPAQGETPGDATLTREFVDEVSRCMKELNPRHREILELRIVHNFSYEEIAEALDISVGTVKSRIARARESLREKMGRDFE